MLAASYTLRRADAGDVPGIVRLARPFAAASAVGRYLTLTAEKVTAAVATRVADPDGCALIVEHDGYVVGTLLAGIGPHWLDPDARLAVELGWWVDPEHRGTGRQLLEAFHAWAAEQRVDARVVSAIRMREGAPADAILERAGYEPVEVAFMKSGGGC